MWLVEEDCLNLFLFFLRRIIFQHSRTVETLVLTFVFQTQHAVYIFQVDELHSPASVCLPLGLKWWKGLRSQRDDNWSRSSSKVDQIHTVVRMTIDIFVMSVTDCHSATDNWHLCDVSHWLPQCHCWLAYLGLARWLAQLVRITWNEFSRIVHVLL